jgi:phospholipid/cholesterol/gamma-HCH transport system ATP-binding protein
MTPAPLLSMRGLARTFGGNPVHRGIDLDLMQGECLTLLGGSGTGKSLILRSIIGLEQPDDGSICFHGQELLTPGRSQRDWNEVRLRIGYVFQNGALFDSLSVHDNLAYPLRAHTRLSEDEISKKVRDILELVDMPEAGELLPGELSGGMQKRAGLARAMILGPEILLLDEPTAGLDPTNTLRFVQNIRTLRRRGVTTLFVTHDIPAALALADRIAVLDQGRIHGVQTVDEFRHSKDPVIRRFNIELNTAGAGLK